MLRFWSLLGSEPPLCPRGGWGGSEGTAERLLGRLQSSKVGGFVGLCPVWVAGQVEHGHAPRVDGQRNADDAEDVHHHAGFHLRNREQRATGEAGRGGA